MDYRALFSRGDKVEVSTNREFTDSMFGELITVADNAVNIRYTTEQEQGILRFCWHEDDPRMQELGKFEASQERNTDDRSGEIHMGLFRLTRSQALLNEMPALLKAANEKVDALDVMVERLVRRVAVLEPKAQSAANSLSKPARKRGRPPKVAPPEPEATPALETAGAAE